MSHEFVTQEGQPRRVAQHHGYSCGMGKVRLVVPDSQSAAAISRLINSTVAISPLHISTRLVDCVDEGSSSPTIHFSKLPRYPLKCAAYCELNLRHTETALN